MDGECDVPLKGALSFVWSGFQKVTVFQAASSRLKIQGFNNLYETQLYASAKRNDFMQRLARSSYDIFRVSQVCNDSSDLLRLSHQYRATLAMCYQEIFEFLETCQNVSNERVVALTAEGEQVKAYELIWHLCEIILLQTLDAEKLSFSLTNWYFVQSQEAVNIARNLLETANRSMKPDEGFDNVFWPTALALLTQARPMEAASLLASHPKANSELYRDVRQLLITMPVGDPQQLSAEAPWTKSGASIDRAWHYWQCSCGTRLAEETRNQTSTANNTDVEYLILMLSIMAGKQDCWHDQRVSEACGTWYFHFVGWLFYTHCFVQTSSLATMLEQFKLTFRRNDFQHDEASLEAVVDEIIGYIMSEDILAVVYAMSEKFPNWWIVAHFSSLVKRLLPDFFSKVEPPAAKSHAFSLKPEDGASAPRPLSLTATMPDFFLLRYAESLASEPSLLSIALSYLDHCSTIRPIARELQATLLRRTRPSTTRFTNNLLRLARKHQLGELVEEIARTKMRSALAISGGGDEDKEAVFRVPQPIADPSAVLFVTRTCSALGWAIVARDVGLITQLASRTLLSMSSPTTTTRGFSWRAIKEVASLITCLFGGSGRSWLTTLALSPELAAIARYVNLQEMLDSGSPDTTMLVHTLLDILSTSDSGGGFHLPLHFRLHLLSQVKPHLNAATLSMGQTEALVAVVTEIKALLRLLRDKNKVENEETRTLLLSWSALLTEARAVAILRVAKGDSGEDDEYDAFGELLTCQVPSDYPASEL